MPTTAVNAGTTSVDGKDFGAVPPVLLLNVWKTANVAVPARTQRAGR